MIIGSLTQTKRFEILHPDFKKVFEYVRSGNWQQVTAGKIILEEDKIWVNVDEVTGKSREAAKLAAVHDNIAEFKDGYRTVLGGNFRVGRAGPLGDGRRRRLSGTK